MILPGRGTAGAKRARDSGMSTLPPRLSLAAFPASFASGAQSAPSITACRSAGAWIRNSLEAFATSRMPCAVLSPSVPPRSPLSVQNVILRAFICPPLQFAISAERMRQAEYQDQEHPQHQRPPDQPHGNVQVFAVGHLADPQLGPVLQGAVLVQRAAELHAERAGAAGEDVAIGGGVP